VPAATAISPQEAPPPGGIKLVAGHHHQQQQGIDSKVGTISKRYGVEVHYDVWPEDYTGKQQIINEQQAVLIFAGEKRLVISFPEIPANLYGTLRTRSDMMDMLLTLGTFRSLRPQLAEPAHNVCSELEHQIQAVAGTGAVNCGTAEVSENPLKVSTCAVNAFQAKKSFYAVYRMAGIDSVVGRAVVQDGYGKVFVFLFDSSSTDWKPAAGETITENRHIIYRQCDSPVTLIMSRTGRIKCANLPSLFNLDQGICGASPVATNVPVWGHSGTLDAEITIDEKGKVSQVTVSKSNFSSELTDTILRAIQTWAFEPALKDEHAVRVKIPVSISSAKTSQTISFPMIAATPFCLNTPTRITR